MMLNGLVPARFLTLISQLVLTISLYWSKENNILACLPSSPTPSTTSPEYSTLNTQLIIGLSVSLGLLAFELFGFLGGISMLMPSQGLISLCTHGAGTFMLVLFLFDVWCSSDYWFIFGFCCAAPFVTEVATWLGVFALKKSV